MHSFKQYVLLSTYIILLTMVLMNLDKVVEQIGNLFTVFTPITYGFVIAYLLNFLLRGVEKHLLAFMDHGPEILRGFKRSVAILLTFTICGIALYAAMATTVPELSASFSLLISKSPEMIANATREVTDFFKDLQLDKISPEMWNELTNSFSSYSAQLVQMVTEGSTRLLQMITEGLPKILSATSNIAVVLFDLVIGLIISVYLLAGKERLQLQLSRVVTALFNPEWSQRLHYIATLTTKSFNNYVYGKLLDSVLVFAMTFLGMALLQLPYAALISLIVTITNLVPYIGPFVGGFVCFFLIGVLDLQQAVIFVLLDFVVQQIEGNILGPQVFGNALGLPGLWVMVSVFIGGGFFGVIGMVVAPPVMTVFYVLMREYINERFQSKMPRPATLLISEPEAEP